MPKLNQQSVMDRWVAFYRRQMQDQIMVTFDTGEAGSTQWPDIGEERGQEREWTDRPCRSEVDMERIMQESSSAAKAIAAYPDDSLPSAYPTGYFGEGIASGLLGGNIRFVGNADHTCSISEPLIKSWDDLSKLRYGKDMPWAQRYQAALRKAAEMDSAHTMFFHHFVTMDTLNLAVELRGSTQACLDIYENPERLRDLMQFGVDYSLFFFELENEIMGPHNEAVAGGHPYGREGVLPWSSVDAYVLCHPQVYRRMGLEYHREFFARRPATMHTHGTRLMELLPMIAEIPDICAIQPGMDLWSGDSLPLLELLPEIRRITGDIPLTGNGLGASEFVSALEQRRLVGGAHYSVSWPNLGLDEMARWMERVHAYRWYG